MSAVQQLKSAVGFHQAGNYSLAEEAYRQVLLDHPDNADALHLLGLLKYQTGDAGKAVEFIEKAIQVNSRIPDFHNNCGEAYRALGNFEKAKGCYRRAIKLNPQHTMAHNNLALILIDQSGYDEAAKHLKAALKVSPEYVEAIYNLGRLYYLQGRLEAALKQLQKVDELNPGFYPAWNMLGNIYFSLGQYGQALHYYNKALEYDPHDVAATNSKGLVLVEMGDLDAAALIFQQLLSRSWKLPEVHCNLGVVLNKQDRLEDALESFRQALALKPDYLEAEKNLASTLRDLGRIEDSISSFKTLVQRYPELGDAHFGLAFSLLLNGDYENGWREYEWRWSASNSPQAKPNLKGKEWQGEPLKNKTILVYCEQGAGDAIQFIRFVPLLARQGAHVVVQCPDALADLFATVEGVTEVFPGKKKVKGYDVHCAIMSLPLHLGITLENLPTDVPYLNSISKNFGQLNFSAGKFRVGIVWAGSRLHSNDRKRSCNSSLLQPLSEVEGVEFHSLQKLSEDEIAPSFMINHGEQLSSYNDTAALIEKLDLVISVDTSVAHLAGALGKPLWLLLPYAPDWRWQVTGEHSVWYPMARLFRQDKPGDWSSVMQRLKIALQGKLTGEENTIKERVTIEELPEFHAPDGFNQLQACRYGLMLFNKNDAYVGRSLKYYGEFSEGESEVFAMFIKQGNTVVEVGANIGAHTLFLSQLVGDRGEVVAIEPQRIVYQTLCANLALNSTANVRAYQVGVGDKMGEIVVPYTDPNQPHNFGGVSLGDGEGEQVPLITLDSLNLKRCDLLKLDVEGMECEVIAGAHDTLKRFKPIMYVENDRREKSAQLIQMIHELGYRLWWHQPPLFNKDNYAGNKNNIFGDIVSLNMICLPKGIDMPFALPEVDDPEYPWR